VTADLTGLALEDVYAVYAGWHARHDQIRCVERGAWSEEHRSAADQLASRLQDAGYLVDEPEWLGEIFGDLVLASEAKRNDEYGLVMADARGYQWLTVGPGPRRLGAREAWWLYLGRRLLSIFNAPRGAA
jgi:hypothetical protein